MRLNFRIANINVSVNLENKDIEVKSFINDFFKEFIIKDTNFDYTINIKIVKESFKKFNNVINKKTKASKKPFIYEIKNDWYKKNKFFQLKNLFQNIENSKFYKCLNAILAYNKNNNNGTIFVADNEQEKNVCIYKLLSVYLSIMLGENNACLIHSAGVKHNNKGYVFLGVSGSGKTTLAKLCRVNSLVYSDDAPIIRQMKNKYFLFPSPFHDFGHDGGLGQSMVDEYVEIHGFYFLFKSKMAICEDLDIRFGFTYIIQKQLIFYNFISKQAKLKLFDIFLNLCHTKTLCNFYFNKDSNIWKVID